MKTFFDSSNKENRVSFSGTAEDIVEGDLSTVDDFFLKGKTTIPEYTVTTVGYDTIEEKILDNNELNKVYDLDPKKL